VNHSLSVVICLYFHTAVILYCETLTAMKYVSVPVIIITVYEQRVSFVANCRWKTKQKHFLVNWNSLWFLSRCAF